MKLRNKLVIGFSTLMILMGALTYVSYDRLKYMNKQLDYIYSDRYSIIKDSSSMRGEINDMGRILTNILQARNPEYTGRQQERLQAKTESALQDLDQIKQSAKTAEERLIISGIETANNAFIEYKDQVLVLLEEGEFDQANQIRLSQGQEIQDGLISSLNGMRDYLNNKIDEAIAEVKAEYQRSIQITVITMSAGLILGLAIILWILPSIGRGLNTVNMMMRHFGRGELRAIREMRVQTKDEIGDAARIFQEMSEDLEEKQELERNYLEQQKNQSWIDSNLAKITDLFHGVHSLDQISQKFISEFTPILGGFYGAIYLQKDENLKKELQLAGTYAMDGEMTLQRTIKLGEGLLGQAALDKQPISLEQAPEQYISVRSALGGAKPSHILIQPIMFEDDVLGVVEIATFTEFTVLEQRLLHEISDNLGVVVNNISRRLRVEELLRESQALTEELQVQSEELQTQQEELRRSNESMEKQTEALKRSEQLLQRQQEELEHYNTELVAKTRALEEQVYAVEEKNEEIQKTKEELERQASQLALTSKYKSEFLANMSHELRTPLNSLLILSQLLSENKDSNLNPKQVEYAQTIHMAGADLLKMIDEILDLAKVDAGKMEIHQETIAMYELRNFVDHNFAPVAQSKQIDLRIEVERDVPEQIQSDSYRVKQILRNLLSNAFKFTSHGEVAFRIEMASPEELPNYLDSSREYIAMIVEDTGIGIPSDKTDLIFEAFQQVDGTTSRKYGGTGLGLSISRGLADLLGGGIGVTSQEGKGSRFTLYLPKEAPVRIVQEQDEAAAAIELIPSMFAEREKGANTRTHVVNAEPVHVESPIEDDRNTIISGDKVMLIIEDDIHFARILLEMSRSHGFKTIIAVQGDTGLQLAKSYIPDAIILDIQLPVIDGWSILNELKSSAETRHIPVHVISVVDDVKQGLLMGAIAFLRKPSSKEHLERAFTQIESYTEKTLRHLLVVEDDERQRQSIVELIGHDDVAITAVSSGFEALNQLNERHYDCMVLDLMLTDMSGFELLDRIREDDRLRDLPIIIYTGKDLDQKEETLLRRYAESIIIKDVKSPERLLDETTLFLHRVEADLPPDKRRILQKLHNKEELFENKTILLVDDDVRNVFALSSVLEGYRMKVICAENGREALEMLAEHKDIDLVLMDMMMPEMDGYEAMRHIRQNAEYAKLPIIALTAKAMKEDRQKCIEAGASDYVKKPIQTDQLLSLMRVWLYS